MFWNLCDFWEHGRKIIISLSTDYEKVKDITQVFTLVIHGTSGYNSYHNKKTINWAIKKGQLAVFILEFPTVLSYQFVFPSLF